MVQAGRDSEGRTGVQRARGGGRADTVHPKPGVAKSNRLRRQAQDT